jgi:hypothetical protein
MLIFKKIKHQITVLQHIDTKNKFKKYHYSIKKR